jgi:hypothetical protein
MQTSRSSGIGGVIVAALMVIFAAVVIWETTTYADFDSAVFPRTVAIVLIACCLAYIAMWLAGLTRAAPPAEDGSSPRRVGLVLLMLASAFIMPWAGFVLSSLLLFAALTALAMYERWTPFRLIVYPLVGIAIVIGFYMLFGQLLRVPLPAGQLFG